MSRRHRRSYRSAIHHPVSSTAEEIQAQALLAQLPAYVAMLGPSGVDKIFGPKSRQALAAFQQDQFRDHPNGSPFKPGHVDAATLAALRRQVETSGKPDAKASLTPSTPHPAPPATPGALAPDHVLKTIPSKGGIDNIRGMNGLYAERLALTLEYMKNVKGWGTAHHPGMTPIVEANAVRSADQERRLIDKGVSFVKNPEGRSMHMPGPEGSGASDITLKGAPGNFAHTKDGKQFYGELAEAAALFGLESGHEWQFAEKGAAVRHPIRGTVVDEQGHPVVDTMGRRVYDPAHIQIPERHNTGHRTNVPTTAWIEPIETGRIGADILEKLYASLLQKGDLKIASGQDGAPAEKNLRQQDKAQSRPRLTQSPG